MSSDKECSIENEAQKIANKMTTTARKGDCVHMREKKLHSLCWQL